MKALSDICTRRPVTSMMVVCGLTLLGVIAFFQIPVALLPAGSFPGLTVEIEYPGVGPHKIEEILTIPLEEAVSTVGGIEELSSVSEEGKARVDLEFARGAAADGGLDFKALEVRERVDLAAAVFPREVQRPIIVRYDPDKRPVIIVVLEDQQGDLTATREFADREIKKALEGATGVSEIIVAGGKQREILVSCDKDRLQSFGLSMQDLLTALQTANVSRSLGNLKHEGGSYDLIASGRFRDLQEIRDLIVESTPDGRRIAISDVAAVSNSFRDEDTASRLNGQERVSLYIHKAGDANLLQLSDDVEDILTAYRRDGLGVTIVYDQADLIRRAMRAFALAGLATALLAGTGIYLAFGMLRLTSLVLVTLPVAFLISSFFLYLTGFEYNLLTISGFLLGAGISIFFVLITIDAIRRHGGATATAAQTVGASRVLRTGTLLLAATFVPVVFAGPDLRAIYGGLALAVLAPVCVSLVLSATVLPVLLRRRTAARVRFPARFQRTADALRARAARAKLSLDSFFARVLPRWISATLEMIAKRPEQAAACAATFAFLGVCAFVFARHELAGAIGSRELNVSVEFPSGTSFGPTNAISKTVEKKLLEQEGVREVTSRVEAGKATLRVKLRDSADIGPDYVAALKESVGSHEPAFIYFGADSDASALREITIDVMGEDLAQLDQITKGLAGGAKNYEGVDDVVLRYKAPRPEMLLRMDRVKAERAGLTVSEAGQNIRFAIQGGVATKFLEDDRELDVRIRYDEKFRNRLEDLAGFFLKTRDGRFVPALEIGRMEEGRVPVKIYRKNKKRAFSFSLQTGAADFDTITAELERLRALPLPENYRIEFGREFRQALQSRRRLAFIVALSLLLVYMILASYCESLTRPLQLLLPVPVPILGVVLILFVLRIPLGLPVYLGLLILAGIVVLQSMLHEQALRPAREARAPGAAIFADRLRANFARLLPALPAFARASAIVAVFLLPFALVLGPGGDYIRGIALAVCAGLLISAISTPLATIIVASLAQSSSAHEPGARSWRKLPGLRFALALCCLLLTLHPAERALAAPAESRADGQSLTLDLASAVKIGVANDFALRSLVYRKAAARQLLTERWRAYLPSLGVSFDRTRAVTDAQQDALTSEIRFTIEQLIYDGGQRALDLDLAKIDALLAEQDFKLTYAQLTRSIQNAYLDALSAHGKIELNLKSLERARVQLRQAQLEEQVGFSTKVQVLTIASRMREIELAVQRAHNQYNQAIYNLKEVMNLDFQVDLRLRGDLFRDFSLKAPAVEVDELVERARNLRPEFKRSLARVHRLKKEKEIAEDEWIPRISVGGYVGRAGEEFPLREETWGVNFRVTFPIGPNTTSVGSSLDTSRDGSTRTGSTNSQISLLDDLGHERRVLEGKTALTESINEHQQLSNSLAIEVSRAYDNLRESWESIRIGNGRVYFQYASIRILEASYQAGVIRRTDILQAEIDLVQAQEDLTDAISAYLKAIHEIEFVAALDSGALRLYSIERGTGNTLPGKLLDGDFDQIEQQGKQDLDPGEIRKKYLERDTDDENERFEIEQVPLD